MGSNNKLKSWGFFLGGLGIFLLAIAFLIKTVHCPVRSKVKDFFRPPCSSTVTKTVYSPGSAPPASVSARYKKEFTDEDFEEFYKEYRESLAEQKIPKLLLDSLCSEETKESLRKSFKDASQNTQVSSIGYKEAK